MTWEWIGLGAAFAVLAWIMWDNYRLELENQRLREMLREIEDEETRAGVAWGRAP